MGVVTSVAPWCAVALLVLLASCSRPDAARTDATTSASAAVSAPPPASASASASPSASVSASASAPAIDGSGAPISIPSPDPLPPDAPAPLRVACDAAQARVDALIALRPPPDPRDLGLGANREPSDHEIGLYGRCFAAGTGAWLLDLETSPDPRWSDVRKARIWPSFVSEAGKVTRAQQPLPMHGAAVRDKVLHLTEVGPIVDWDEDGSLDLLLRLDGLDLDTGFTYIEVPIQRHLDFRLRAGRVESIPVPPFVSSKGTDVDHDGHLDYIIDRPLPAHPCDTGLPPPRGVPVKEYILAHGVGHGVFRVDDEEARRWYRRRSCSSYEDTPLINLEEGTTERRIHCARLLGQSPAEVTARLRKEFAAIAPSRRDQPCVAMGRWLKAATWRPEQVLTER